MAQFTTYDATQNREDLMDSITRVALEETPLFSKARKVNVSARKVEWLTEGLATAAKNAQVEGHSYSYTSPTAPSRVENWTQIVSKEFAVSNTQEATSTAGMTSVVAHELSKKMTELARDIEYAMINGTGTVTGTSAAAREMKGLLSFITTNTATGGGSALTETKYNDLMQAIKAQGGKPNRVMVNGFQLRKITDFTANSTRQVQASDGILTNSVSVYVGPFGRQEITYNDIVPTDTVLFVQDDMVETGVLRGVSPKKNLAITGDFTPAVIEGELTLIALNEKACGKITNLASA